MTEEQRERLVTATVEAIHAEMLPDRDEAGVAGGMAWNLALRHAARISARTIRLAAPVDYATESLKRLPEGRKGKAVKDRPRRTEAMKVRRRTPEAERRILGGG